MSAMTEVRPHFFQTLRHCRCQNRTSAWLSAKPSSFSRLWHAALYSSSQEMPEALDEASPVQVREYSRGKCRVMFVHRSSTVGYLCSIKNALSVPEVKPKVTERTECHAFPVVQERLVFRRVAREAGLLNWQADRMHAPD